MSEVKCFIQENFVKYISNESTINVTLFIIQPLQTNKTCYLHKIIYICIIHMYV